MKIGLVGSGGREHALAHTILSRSSGNKLFVFGSSNNPGIKPEAAGYQTGKLNDNQQILDFMKQHAVDYVVVGPEVPLINGLVDDLRKLGIPAIGPTRSQARLEGDKAFMRDLMQRRVGFGSPDWLEVKSIDEARDFIGKIGDVAIKPLGLTGGKGVQVMGVHLNSLDEALADIGHWIEKEGSVLLEERLLGEEFSRMAFVSGENVYPMPIAQDHKYAYDGDSGNMTGGMGAYTMKDGCMPFLTESDQSEADSILQHVIKAISEECDEAYHGFLYGQFIATARGVRVIEFNVRLGDPEAMNVMSLYNGATAAGLASLATGQYDESLTSFEENASLVKYLVPAGYPDRDDGPVHFSFDEEKIRNAGFSLFFASVERDASGWKTLGSRTMAIYGTGEHPADICDRMETLLDEIQPDSLRHRKDVGSRDAIAAKIDRMNRLRQGRQG